MAKPVFREISGSKIILFANSIAIEGKWKETIKDGINCWYFDVTVTSDNIKKEKLFSHERYLDVIDIKREDVIIINSYIHGFLSLEKDKYISLSDYSSLKPAKR